MCELAYSVLSGLMIFNTAKKIIEAILKSVEIRVIQVVS